MKYGRMKKKANVTLVKRRSDVDVSPDPEGNRAQRRAAKKMKMQPIAKTEKDGQD